ncbi:PepSY domain-containing protein [Sphingomonas sp. MMSM24]|uniref:PepSY domain-containing protein n=2 Tax=Sphingomonas lycopersici TaxID=2951807 RepID=A0AA42CRH2_9SPHN|nr:PepSY domain-containing protein [Sphingomonas lycopersici]
MKTATMTSKKYAAGWRRALLKVHRWLGLAAGLFWLVQAITGCLITFHWEAEDLGYSAVHRATDFGRIERRLGALAPPGSGVVIKSVWTTAGLADRYDINLDDNGVQRAVRIAGDGTILGTRRKGALGVMGTLVSIHQTLLAGDIGEWIVGISGTLLLTNLVAGLWIGWPRKGSWRRTLTPATRGALVARVYSWHRAIGLWAAVPALVLVSAGVLRRFETGVSTLLGAKEVSLPPIAPIAITPIRFARAIGTAAAALPGSRFTMAALPSPNDATYRVRVLAPGEWRRAYGTSTVLVNANDGSVRGIFSAAAAPLPRAFVDDLYAIHTGEAAGLVGRVLATALGLWLAAMSSLGALLWSRRRASSAQRRASGGVAAAEPEIR